MSPTVATPVYDLEGNRIMEDSTFPESAKQFFLPVITTPSGVFFTERALLRNTRHFVKVKRFDRGEFFQEQPRSLALVELMKRYPQS